MTDALRVSLAVLEFEEFYMAQVHGDNLNLLDFSNVERLSASKKEARQLCCELHNSLNRLVKDEASASGILAKTLHHSIEKLEGVIPEATTYAPHLYRLAFLRVLDRNKWNWYPHPSDSVAESIYEELRAFETRMVAVGVHLRTVAARTVAARVVADENPERFDNLVRLTVEGVETARILYNRSFPLPDDSGGAGRPAPLAPDPPGRAPGNFRTFEEAMEPPCNP